MDDDSDENAAAVASSIASALIDEDPELGQTTDEPAGSDEAREQPNPSHAFPWRRTYRPSLGGGAGGAPAGGPVRARSEGSGRGGSGSRRQIVRGARRAGAAFGGAYALRKGEPAPLAELGLNLSELQGMSAWEQRDALLNAALGQPNHPDEFALRKAAHEFLKRILTDAAEPNPVELIREFMSQYITTLATVELVRQADAKEIDAATAIAKENKLGNWIKARMRREDFGATGPLVALADFRRLAARLAQTAVQMLRAG